MENELVAAKIDLPPYFENQSPENITEIKPAERQKLTFELGLVMAGAVSAGSYTAGVVDFLMESLDAWQKIKDLETNLPVEQCTVPYHDVRIKVIAGASAGGMTGAVLSAQIRNKAVGVQMKEKPLRDVWVEKIDIQNLLEDSDLRTECNSIRSILDSTKITEIADEAFNFQDGQVSWQQPPYIHEKLKLILSLSNLRGVPYEFNIQGETGFKYGMFKFADYEKVSINKDTSAEEWERVKDAALATGAFPMGLSARLIHRDPKEYVRRSQEEKKEYISVKFDDQKTYSFTCVDGGVFNNEPLELARKELYKCSDNLTQQGFINSNLPANIDVDSDEYKTYLKNLDRALILIDPFPNIIEVSDKNDKEDSLNLFKVFPRLIAALRRQAIFKPEELFLAAHKQIYSSFMISPLRYTKNGLKAEYPIACGFLEGFGGFFLKAFREHDYELGRRNCQRFLERYFVVPAEDFKKNPIFSASNRSLLATYQVADVIEECSGDKATIYFPIIPLMGSRSKMETYQHILADGQNIENSNMQRLISQPEWPGYKTSEFEALTKKLSKRIKLVIDRLLPNSSLGWIIRNSLLLSIGLFVIALGLFFVVWSRPLVGVNYVLLSYTQTFAMLITGMVATVAFVFYLLRKMVLKKIKGLLRNQLKSYAFFD